MGVMEIRRPEEKLSQKENRSAKMMQDHSEEKKMIKKCTQMWSQVKNYDECIVGVPERKKERKREWGRIFQDWWNYEVTH